MWKCLLNKFKGKNGKRGFTLMELLAVVGIIAILCSVAIISAFAIKRNMDFKQRNDYAKTIFMAAQTRLSQLRSEGALSDLRGGNVNSGSIPGGSGFPGDASQYRYTYSNLNAASGVVDSFAAVLPVNSVEEQLRVNQIIIEYNPLSGNVYAVFYSESKQTEENLLSQYLDGKLPRDDESQRKAMMLGYYEGSVLLAQEEEPAESTMYTVQAELVYTNDQEAKVTANIPVPGAVNANSFASGLNTTMTVVGDDSGKETTLTATSKTLSGNVVVLEYLLDSLKDGKSFASASSGITTLTSITNESKLTVLPGENVTLKLTATYPNSNVTVDVKPGLLSGVNPLFKNLTTNPDGTYTVTVANGRHLQNLNLMSPSVAAKVSMVSFFDATGEGIDWTDTVDYYGSNYSNSDKSPARALPYFVPIQNGSLFGTSTSTGSGNADVAGNGCVLKNFDIDSSKYTSGKYYVSPSQNVTYTNCGVFGFAGTNVDISFLNTNGITVKGDTIGSLVGKKVGGSIRNCSATGSITADSGSYVGGIVGDNSAAMSDCVSGVTITYKGSNSSARIGGLAGKSATGTIQNCTTTGTITVPSTGCAGYVGGFVGENASAISGCNFDVSVTYSNTSDTTAGIGGVAGKTSGGSITNCTISGSVTVTSAGYVGGLVGDNAGGLSGSTSGVTVSFTGTTSTTARVGGLAGKSATGTIQNCKTTGTVTVKHAGYVGGFVGENTSSVSGCTSGVSVTYTGTSDVSARVGGVAGKMSSGSISTCTISGTISATRVSYLGGLVGENTSNITKGNTSSMAITYKPTISSYAAIAKVGGLVGQMTGGALKNSDAAGSITFSPTGSTASNKKYQIGGVAGYVDGSGVSFDTVTSTVTVPSNASGSATVVTNVEDPAGKGPVGMFVGFVNQGTFENCSSTATNSTYQFLGQIQCIMATLANTDTDCWFSKSDTENVENVAMGSGDTFVTVAPTAFTKRADGYQYVADHSADLSGCTFVYSSKTYTQTFGADHFFHGSESGSSGSSQEIKNVTEVFTDAGDVMYSQLFKTTASITNHPTSYYIKKGNGYSRLYLNQTYSSTLKKYDIVLTDEEGVVQHTISDLQLTGNTVPLTLYKRSFAEGNLLITDLTGRYALRLDYSASTKKAVAYELPVDADGNLIEGEEIDSYCFWMVDEYSRWLNVGAKSLNSKSYYLSPNSTNLATTSAPGTGYDLRVERLGEGLYSVKRWSSGSKYYYVLFNASNAFARSTASASAPNYSTLMIRAVVAGTSSTKVANYLYQSLDAEPCVAKAADGSLLS